ncbi:hypothetical protein FHETE_4586 [Fusarium heterosporum]|uniref:Uncharacterized protein n=1 Tax=Fusarium heterosporum TaxID=42747 RepID=A0A8H5TJH4_FUSHE|nr:hypothetical protein FHETE_4586 [Fusarium heterosporum]
MGEPVEQSLLVPMCKDLIATVYHSIGLTFPDFETFYAYGFDHQTVRNELGLPPMFVSRPYAYRLFVTPLDSQKRLEIEESLFWLTIHGFMAPTPNDPQNLGLNVHATGTHFVAAQTGAHLYICITEGLCKQIGYNNCLQSARDLFCFLAKAPDRDECICWCHVNGDGCSPLHLLYKTHAHCEDRFKYGMGIWDDVCWDQAAFNALLLDFEIFERHDNTETSTGQVPDNSNKQFSMRAIEFLRLLTFEALEMRHTCCMYESVETLDIALQHDYWDCYTGSKLEVILSCDPAVAKAVRSDIHEQASAELLDSLMANFTTEMEQNYSKGTFSKFIFGYWQSRIQELYSIQHGEVEKMEQILENVQIGIWPRPVERLLWHRDRWRFRNESISSEDETAEEIDDCEDSESDGL